MPAQPESQAPTRASRRHRRQAQQLAEQLASVIAEGAQHPHRQQSVTLPPITLPDLTPVAESVQQGTQPTIALAPLTPIAPPANHAEAARRQAQATPVADSSHTPTHHTVFAPQDRIQAPELAKLTAAAAHEVAASVARGASHKRLGARRDHSSVAAILGGQEVTASRQAAQEHVNTVPQRHAHERAIVQELRETTIPRLQRRERKLSSVDPLGFDSTATDPLGISTDTDRAAKLAAVQSELAQAEGRAENISGLIRQRRGRRAPQITPLEVGAAIAGAIPPVRGAELLALGARALGRGGAEVAGETAARAGAEAAETAARSGIRGAADRIPHPYTAARGAVARAGSAALTRTGERVGATRLGEAIARGAARPGVQVAARVGATAAKVVGKPAAYAVRHPFKAPILAQAPIALATGDPKEFGKAFTGEGVLATGLNAAGDAIAPGGIVGNLVRDVFSLPSSVLPSVYLPIAGIIEAAGGDSTRLDELWKSYEETGLFPAIFSGDPSKILTAIKNHPLFTALEGSGAYALAGRGAGAIARHTGSDLGSTAREPLTVYGKGEGRVTVPRSYSKNLISKAIQKGLEERKRARGEDPNQASAKLAEKILTGKSGKMPVLEGQRNIPIGLIHRFMDSREKIRRENRTEVGKTFLAKQPDQGAGVVSEVVQGSLRSPETWHEDLTTRLADLQAEELQGNLTSSEIPLNHELQASIEAALKLKDPAQIHEVFDAADEFIVSQGPLIKKLVEKGLLDPEQAERAIRMVYAKRFMGATRGHSKVRAAAIEELKAKLDKDPTDIGTRSKLGALQRENDLIDSQGKVISTEAMREHMAENGVDAGFLTHRPGITGSGSHYRAAIRRPSSLSKKRTGASFDRGAYESGFKALAAQLRQSRTIVDQAGTVDAFAKKFGTGPGDGRDFFGDFDEGSLVASEINANPEFARAAGIPEGLEMVPMRIDNSFAKKAERESIDRNAAPEGEGLLDPLREDPDLVPERIRELAADSFKPGPGKVVLVPKTVREEFLSHQAPAAPGMRSFQSVNQQFKTTVLPTSPKWVLGNTFDLQIRELANGIAPFPLTLIDPRYRVGRAIAKEQLRQNPEAAMEFRSQTTGTAFTGEEMLQMHQGGNRIANALERFRATPGPGHLLRGYEAYARWMFRTQEAMERVGTTAGVGKVAMDQIREQGKSNFRVITLQKPAIEELAKGLLHTDSQLRAAHELEDMYGRWKANSPEVRKTWLQFSPFWMWTRAATRFVLLTLPFKHPIKTALITMAAEMTEQERRQLGLDLADPNHLPPNLQGSIPLPGGAMLPTNYYSSFGVFGNYPDTLASSVLPQVSGALANLGGLDWKGDKLRNPDGTYTSPTQNAEIAANSVFEAFIPGLSIARRIQEGGGSSASTSTALTPQTTESNPGDGPLAGLLHYAIPSALPAGLVEYLRAKAHSQEITVPLSGSSSGSVGSGSYGYGSSSGSGYGSSGSGYGSSPSYGYGGG